ncbi:MAG: phosphatidate cytidylyltransferase [Micavibrio aeruginosavorus]|uniref:Phosphatidate cytidylyltransferase n=1 Tax=Micavibrio aeruginosavorus TaxID=349221 RepID=A0A2W5MXA3_9BACT|nr:MAG: phosphatidate cytidylyltransferase [Micavibrio aeruginosavorus]
MMPVVLYAVIYGGWPFLFMVGVAIGISVKEWVRMAKATLRPFMDGVLGVLYILACFAAFVYLRDQYANNGAGLTLCLMLCVWSTDIGAYFSGKTIGGPKMAPSISPNKTWAGLIGGVLSSIGLFFLYAFYIGPYLAQAIWSDLDLPSGFTPALIAAFGAMIAVSGQIGDLLISHEKRKVGVKDTGTLIPGHGGLLDRIDALLLASLVFLIALKVVGL